jgi:hypothetical protein
MGGLHLVGANPCTRWSMSNRDTFVVFGMRLSPWFAKLARTAHWIQTLWYGLVSIQLDTSNPSIQTLHDTWLKHSWSISLTCWLGVRFPFTVGTMGGVDHMDTKPWCDAKTDTVGNVGKLVCLLYAIVPWVSFIVSNPLPHSELNLWCCLETCQGHRNWYGQVGT